MLIGAGTNTYKWIEDWAKLPDTASYHENGRTHGIAVTDAGDVVVFAQGNPAVLVYGPDGILKQSWGDRFPGAHGLTLVKEGDTEYLWLTDHNTTEVVKTTLDGTTVMNLLLPAGLPAYSEGKYAPTLVAVNEERFGGNGDIWVADGYGRGVVHRYDKTGAYIGGIDGSEGAAGAFKCPHGIFVDTRRGEPELYIADRGNQRVQVYGVDGTYRRVFGTEFLNSPCAFATHGDQIIVPELRARLAVLDAADSLVCYLGDNGDIADIPGWPNHPKNLIEAGKFNSPHGIAAAANGDLYIAEWIIGGRITKLERVV